MYPNNGSNLAEMEGFEPHDKIGKSIAALVNFLRH